MTLTREQLAKGADHIPGFDHGPFFFAFAVDIADAGQLRLLLENVTLEALPSASESTELGQ
jgi:hypothetical protein